MKMKHCLLAIAAMVVSLSATAQSNNTFADESLSLSGYLQGGFKVSDADDDPASTFYLKRARVSLTGSAKEEKIDYRLQVDMAGSPKICDLYFRYKPSSAFGVQLGQFKLPFAIENDIYGPTTVEFIDYSYITTLLARNSDKYDGIASTGRDIGLQIYGGFGDEKDYKTLSYNLGIFNGRGINVDDNNDAKDVVARLIFKPSKALSISGSWMTAQTNHLGNLRSNRWAAGVIYDVEDFIVRGEYAGAEFNDDDINTFYVMGGYRVKKDWMLVARYEALEEDFENRIIDETYRNRVTLGAVYKPYPFIRFQLNYALEKRGVSESRDSQVTNGLNLMVTAIF